MAEMNIISVPRSARVFTHGRLHPGTEQVWVAAHGYGMLSEYFIKKLEVLDPERYFVIAPEGLSRAYIDGMAGRVGASWMTKEMREEEMEDYKTYLNLVLEQFCGHDAFKTTKLVALGFSQGAATISRWVHSSNHPFSAMILWGGAPGSELFNVKCFDNLPIKFVIGEKDEYISEANKERLKEQSRRQGWSYEILTYPGGHHLDSHLISSLADTL